MPLGLCLPTPRGLSTGLGGKRATCSRRLCQAPSSETWAGRSISMVPSFLTCETGVMISKACSGQWDDVGGNRSPGTEQPLTRAHSSPLHRESNVENGLQRFSCE